MRISDWSSDVCSSDLIPFGPPRPDPIVQNVATREIAAEQPYIHRLTRLGQAASRRGKGLAFCDEVAQLIWGGARDWHLGDHLAGAARRAGLDLANLDAEAERDAEELDTAIAANPVALRSEEHTHALQSLMSLSYAVFSLKQTNQ